MAGSELLRRLTVDWRQTVLFAIAGGLAGQFTTLPQWLGRIEREGIGVFYRQVPAELVSVLTGALLVAFVLRACTRNAAELLARPRKFLLMLSCGTLAATLTAQTLHALLRGRAEPLLMQLHLSVAMEFWLEAMLWGGLMGWLYLLMLQRREDELRLGSLLGKRALLARQLAHSRLGTARAQIDPAMVARVLATVQARYGRDAAGASALLDHLINYLRLAMSRAREASYSMASEIALIRAFFALRESELGIRIALRVPDNDEARPLFAGACARLEAAISLGERDIAIDLNGKE